MNSSRFNEILHGRLNNIISILESKATEYASVDRLYNFKRAARIEETTTSKALWGMATKHLVSVIDMVEDRIPTTEYLVNEKIGDLINYLILLEAVFKENLPIEKESRNVQGIPSSVYSPEEEPSVV
jgi:hypothetical protein